MFTIDGAPQIPVPLSLVGGNSQATITVPSLSIGNHTVSASYSGNSLFSISALRAVDPVGRQPHQPRSAGSGHPRRHARYGRGDGDGYVVGYTRPRPGVVVTFTVIAGPNTGVTGLVVTGADGTASFSYTAGATAGVDTIQATFVDDQGLTETSNQVATQIQATPVITWASPADIVYGASLGSSQLNATANVPGTFAYSPVLGTILHAGANQPLTVTFTPTDTVSYTSVTYTTTINVLKATPILTWGPPADIVYGTPWPRAAQRPGQRPRTFTYTPAAGTVFNLGANQTLTATFTPDDANDFTTAIVTTTINVTPAPQASTVTLTSSANSPTYGQSLIFTATVGASSLAGPTPTGTIQFLIDGVAFGAAVPLIDGVATSPANATLASGGHTIGASYSGDSQFGPSTTSPSTRRSPRPR